MLCTWLSSTPHFTHAFRSRLDSPSLLQGRLAWGLGQRTLQGDGGIQWPRGFEEHQVQQAPRHADRTAMCTSVYVIICVYVIYIHPEGYHMIPVRTAQGGGGSFKDRKPIGQVQGGDSTKTMWIQQWTASDILCLFVCDLLRLLVWLCVFSFVGFLGLLCLL